MKIGDLVEYKNPSLERLKYVGTVIEFPLASHYKEVQKVLVLTGDGPKLLIMQYCEVINEGR